MRELFQDFEINHSPWWERVWRIVAGSVVLHIIFVAIVLYVPAVRDALNIASVFASAEYVDRDYDKTIIRDDVTMLDMRERFEYPPGYFQTGAPPEMPLIVEQVTPIATTPPMTIRPPKMMPQPTPVPTPATSASPTASPAVGQTGNTNQSAVAQASPTPEDVNKQIDRLAAENNVQRPNEDLINKRPLQEWLARQNDLKNKGQLDLSQTVELTIEADLEPSGKLLNAKVAQKTGDPRLIEAAKELVAAISDSNALSFLKDPKFPNETKRLRITVKMDQTEVMAQVESEVPTTERAKQLASVYQGFLLLGQVQKKGKDEEVIYKSTKISANGKQIVVSFKLPRPTAEVMIKKQIQPAT